MFEAIFEIVLKIFNALTITSLFMFAAFSYSNTSTSKYHIIYFYWNTLTFRYKPLKWMWDNEKVNLFNYLIIPFIYGIALILLSQFFDNVMKIRWDIQIILTAFMWVFLLLRDKYKHDLICRLYDKIKELTDRLSKYE